ncbi:RNA polymerase II subunit A C-terminal domain phosphatase SSU72 [Syncephalastrum racemosum]|uniref:RNA polymerase II subunit A C-terminal domain phosphatase SSU72 n=1 Tax=Syncephalastrum racemosum TaxID=13706 RepID=A0A1X2H1P9_SYNRA|nr:RNA polymerase II subunit A C-terminal domain phosphatase SSU72 [Syncephalastrum racemosum]
MVKYAVICASNQNRSMEAHHVLSQRGFDVSSYGTGTSVRLPGPSIDQPNIYPFGTPYDQVYNELKEKDPRLYTQNGLLAMLDRNRRVKEAPQRWHESSDRFDVIITCEERCFDAVVEDLLNRGQTLGARTHVINVEIKDNHEEAHQGGKAILHLAEMVDESKDIDSDIENIMAAYNRDHPNYPLYHTVAFF